MLLLSNKLLRIFEIRCSLHIQLTLGISIAMGCHGDALLLLLQLKLLLLLLLPLTAHHLGLLLCLQAVLLSCQDGFQ